MKTFQWIIAVLLVSVLGVGVAWGQPVIPDDSQGAYAAVINTFQMLAGFWQGTLLSAGMYLFFALATIQLVIVFGSAAVRGADLNEFMDLATKQILFIGVMYFFLVEGFDLATMIIRSFMELGSRTASIGSFTSYALDPASIFQQGLVTAMELADQMSFWSPAKSTMMALCVLIILICFAWCAASMTIAIVEAIIIVGASTIFIAFGSLSFTTDIARRVLMYFIAAGAKIFSMMLVAGVMIRVTEHWIDAFDPGAVSDCLALISFVMLFAMLIKTIPDKIAGALNGAAVGNPSEAAMGAMAATAGAGYSAGKALGALKDAAVDASKALKDVGKSGGGGAGGGGGASTAADSAGGWKDAQNHMAQAGAHSMGALGKSMEAMIGTDPFASGPLAGLTRAPDDLAKPGDEKKPTPPGEGASNAPGGANAEGGRSAAGGAAKGGVIAPAAAQAGFAPAAGAASPAAASAGAGQSNSSPSGSGGIPGGSAAGSAMAAGAGGAAQGGGAGPGSGTPRTLDERVTPDGDGSTAGETTAAAQHPARDLMTEPHVIGESLDGDDVRGLASSQEDASMQTAAEQASSVGEVAADEARAAADRAVQASEAAQRAGDASGSPSADTSSDRPSQGDMEATARRVAREQGAGNSRTNDKEGK